MKRCRNCTKHFDQDKNPGAIILSPPENDNGWGAEDVKKYHICQSCSAIMLVKLDNNDLIGELEEDDVSK